MQLGTTARRLDVAAIRDGIEKECPLRPGLFVRVRPASRYNPAYEAAVMNDAMVMDEDVDREAIAKRFDSGDFIARALVGGMRGIYDDAGEEVEYTTELGATLLDDPAHADVRDWIVIEASKLGAYYAEGVEKKAGNSVRGSSGKRAGAAASRKTKS